MSDLISRRALLQRIKNSTAEKAVKVLAQVLVNTAPAVDAVEVVRCEDCIIHNCCGFEASFGAEGFCSYGERKKR